MGPRRAKVPPQLEPLSAPQNEHERKARQRLHVKRTYYKKLNEMQNQRDRVRKLEQEYARLVAQKKDVTRNHFCPTSPNTNFLTNADLTADTNFLFDPDLLDDSFYDANVGDVLANTCTDNLLLGDLYTEISEIKEKLVAENEATRDAIAEYQRFAHKLTIYTESDEIITSSNNEAAAYRNAILLEPVTLDFCQAFARTAYDDMWQYRESRGFVSSGYSVFGWHDKRLPVGDRVRFSLKKVFQNRTALELSMRGWNVLSMCQSLATMFSASANATFSTIQIVDDDNKILFRLMDSPDGKLLAKTLFMVTRFAIPNGFVVCIKSIDPTRLVPSELPVGTIEKWVEHSTWVTFEVAGDHGEHCEIEFSGELQISPLVPQAAWLLEILFIILRFEGKITGPVFSLC